MPSKCKTLHNLNGRRITLSEYIDFGSLTSNDALSGITSCFIVPSQCNKLCRRRFFSQRVIDIWNSLSECMISTNTFKNRIDKWKTIWPTYKRLATGGDNHSDKPKTVVVKFESYKDRDTVMRAARKEKPRGVFVNEDLSQRVMARRRELMPKLREARQQGKIAYLSYDRLVVRNRVERT